MRRPRPTLALVLLVIWSLGMHGPADVRAESNRPLRITAGADGVHLEWSAPPDLASLPHVEIGGVQLPARLVALRFPDDVPVVPQIERLESVSWRGAQPAAAQPIPQTLAGDLRPALTPALARSLPVSPVVVLRDSRLRGARIVVIAIGPIYAVGGVARAALHLAVTIPGAALLTEDTTQLLSTSTPFLTSTPGPTNPAAATSAVKVRVTQTGIQRMSGAALAAIGFRPSDLSLLHLRHTGAEIAIEVHDGGDGRLDAADELRFYAPSPGDRWNAADTYWLTLEAAPGRRMLTRSALPSGAPARSTALQRDMWRHNTLYDSLLPGPDGDHWFAADLKTGPDQPPMTSTLLLTPTLPLSSGTMTLTVTGSAYTSGVHSLKVWTGAASKLTTWSGAGDWTRTISFTTSVSSAALVLIPGTTPDGVEPDGITSERPVALTFGGAGAAFVGLAGTWRYQLTNTAADRTLYDVSDTAAPELLIIPAGMTTQFQDGPAAHQYVLTSPGTLRTPDLSAHQPVTFAPRAADVIYIAPAAFQSALAPLVSRRQSQGHTVAVIDVQAIYDAWSFGQVAPEAIRSFLRYAATTWHPAPSFVTLVGDGTSDPLNYTGRGNGTFIPPYLAMVDPWIGETACETCYAQLDGADPLSDGLPDLALGRLPVKSVAEAQALVAKIVDYESAPGGIDWRSRAVYIADNYRDAANSLDGAGDFAAFADQSAALQPSGVEIRRLYYDPSPSHIGVAWREPDAARAHSRTLDLLNAGAGLVTYVGHSHQWQWAVTDPTVSPSYLLGLYDADTLSNNGRSSILLEMTCLTSAFQTPAYSGTTIDERLLLQPGGAIAVWGPTGLGVAHGHDALQHGFYTALWNAPLHATIGALTSAGTRELFTSGNCCQDTLRTFALLGDPAMPARVLAARRMYLPLLQH